MQQSQIKNLEYFVGKIVTFITPPINRPLQDRDILSYMLGRVTKIDEEGIWFEHLQTKNLNFIFYTNLISLAEEQVVIKNETQKKEEEIKTPSIQDIRKAISS
jgi:hypothetical protein